MRVMAGLLLKQDWGRELGLLAFLGRTAAVAAVLGASPPRKLLKLCSAVMAC